MKKYSMTCSCGDTMNVEAESREDAVSTLKGMMTQVAIDDHCNKNHPGMRLTESEVHAQIEDKVVEEM